jgi:hypothetical protein
VRSCHEKALMTEVLVIFNSLTKKNHMSEAESASGGTGNDRTYPYVLVR